MANILKHAWELFKTDKQIPRYMERGIGNSHNPARARTSFRTERTLFASVLSKIAIDCASIKMSEVLLDKEGRFTQDCVTGLNNCLMNEANIDQTGYAFMIDIVLSLLDEGVVAVVPTVTDIEPKNGAMDIIELRTGRILEWNPAYVNVRLYNDLTGEKEDINIPKKNCAIIENPLYSVMNEPNSTMQRLIRKLSLLDAQDEASSNGKLDLIVQLPYVVKGSLKKQQAQERLENIESQLKDSQYGVAYIDGAEKVIQLNKSLDNQLLSQIQYLTTELYSQLGITPEVINGTADENTMNNYYGRLIEPILAAIGTEFSRKFLTKTARTQGHAIRYFRDPFKLMPTNSLADIADTFSRNAILSSNEVRQVLGFKPSTDPSADELRNKNLNQSSQSENKQIPVKKEEEDMVNE